MLCTPFFYLGQYLKNIVQIPSKFAVELAVLATKMMRSPIISFLFAWVVARLVGGELAVLTGNTPDISISLSGVYEALPSVTLTAFVVSPSSTRMTNQYRGPETAPEPHEKMRPFKVQGAAAVNSVVVTAVVPIAVLATVITFLSTGRLAALLMITAPLAALRIRFIDDE